MSYWSTVARAVGHWPLQDAASGTNVSSIAGPNGVLAGAADSSQLSAAGPTPWLPRALLLDGATQHVATGMTAGDWSEGTLAVWARPEVTQTDYSGLIVRRGSLSLYAHSDGGLRYNWSASADEFTLTGPLLPNGVWSHVAVRIRSDRVDFFINGVPVGGNALAHPVQSQGNPLYLGLDPFATSRHFQGSLAGAMVFAEALTDAEVGELCDGPEPTLLAQPTLSGTPRVGNALSWTAGSWESHGNGTVVLTWTLQQSNDGTTDWQVVPSSADLGAYSVPPELGMRWVRLAATASNSAGDSAVAYSEPARVELLNRPLGLVAGTALSGGLLSGACRSSGGLQAGTVLSGEVIQAS